MKAQQLALAISEYWRIAIVKDAVQGWIWPWFLEVVVLSDTHNSSDWLVYTKQNQDSSSQLQEQCCNSSNRRNTKNPTAHDMLHSLPDRWKTDIYFSLRPRRSEPTNRSTVWQTAANLDALIRPFVNNYQ
jgi:hypothetical protein